MKARGLIYVPLYEELQQVSKVFNKKHDKTEEFGFMCFTTETDDYDLTIYSINEMGASTAQARSRQLIDYFEPNFIVCLGICGALSDDVDLGDVCFSQEIIDIMENQKVHSGKTTFQPKSYNSNTGLAKTLEYLGVHPSLVECSQEWSREGSEFAKSTLQLDSLSRRTTPHAVMGPIVCGPVVADPKFKKTLQSINRKVVGIETETSGIYQAIRPGESIEVIAIRGVSDLADDRQGSLETKLKGAYREIAAFNAANFLATSLKCNPFFLSALSRAGANSINADPKVENDPIESILGGVIDNIEDSLRETSPEYRAIEKGYTLPVPRIRPVYGDSDHREIEPLDLVSETKLAILEVPSTYPDKGLPWLYARELAGGVANEKVVVPVVVDAKDIHPPRTPLRSVIEKSAEGLLAQGLLMPIAIIKNFDFSGDRKASLILKEIEELQVHCIMFAYGQQSKQISGDQRYASWRRYALCQVSFSSIVGFLSANFSLLSHEAEVIAHRVSETFRAHSVTVHPSYFAGIPKEMLSRFSDANNRAELIDLAVQGYLSFMGAGDTKEVSLKQRTRRLFLRDLAFKIVVQKETITTSQLIDYVDDYSKEYDFGLNALDFVQSFMKNGILTERGETVAFSVTFIQNYLIAEKLAAEPKFAQEYFDPNLNEIDLPTFELYAEIGLSRQVLEDVTRRLDRTIECFEEQMGVSSYTDFLHGKSTLTYKNSGHSLTNGQIKPRFVANMIKSQRIHKAVDDMSKELLGPDSAAESKQKVLDRITEMREMEAEDRRELEVAGHHKSEETKNRSQIMGDWIMATLMLGSAAEELDANTKRSIAANLIKLAALMLDDWLRYVDNVDYETLKTALTEDLQKEAKSSGEEIDSEKVEKFADMVVDIVEMGELMTPFGSIITPILESARNPVLYESIKQVDPQDTVQELLISVWKLEINESNGLEAFKKTIRKLPKDHFLRVTLATFLVYRAYWYRSTERGRRIFATASEETMQPLHFRVPVEVD